MTANEPTEIPFGSVQRAAYEALIDALSGALGGAIIMIMAVGDDLVFCVPTTSDGDWLAAVLRQTDWEQFAQSLERNVL